MEIRGRFVVIAVFAIGIAMSSAAWLHNYRQTDQSADFWGRQRATLLMRSERLELLTLSDLISAAADSVDDSADQPTAANNDEQIVGRTVVKAHDLSDARGLVHFRHALTYDDNFAWDQQTSDGQKFDTAFALRFAEGDAQLVLLFPRDFAILGRLEADDERVTSLPCPRLAPVLVEYLREVGALAAPARP